MPLRQRGIQGTKKKDFHETIDNNCRYVLFYINISDLVCKLCTCFLYKTNNINQVPAYNCVLLSESVQIGYNIQMLKENTLSLIVTMIFLAASLGMFYFAWVSWKEQEPRALKISFGLGLLLGILGYLTIFLTYKSNNVIFFVFSGFSLVFLILFLLPIGKLAPDHARPKTRVDEREIMFARSRLQPGTPRYEEYYANHPEHKVPDDRTRARPGLLSPKAKFANPYAFSSTDSSFSLVDAMQSQVDGTPAPDEQPLSPEEATALVKGLAHYYGALDVGITKLQPYHVYSHIGRGPGEYGAEIPLDHQYAVAFTVEMDFEFVSSAPTGPITMESSRQYVEAAKIATQLAETLRQLGYPARGHIDGNYRIICPLVARDAGLGEIGRMSILMTPTHGPRVRLGVVTTNLQLILDQAPPMMEMIDFCMICKKCAENCPSRSIPMGEREDKDGMRRWVLNAETCFAYWNEAGTDCGICMRVCPYSHPDNPAHNMVRWGIGKSGFFRRAALLLDDVFYGRHPESKALPTWLKE
jgi:ferredoxin